MSSNIENYSTFNTEHDWEDLCLQLRNRHTCTIHHHNQIRGEFIFQSNFCICFVEDLFNAAQMYFL